MYLKLNTSYKDLMLITYQGDDFQEQRNAKPEFSEISHKFLTDQLHDNISNLVEHMKSLKLTPRWYANNSYNFKHKGKIIFRLCLSNSLDNVKIFLTMAEKRDLDDILLSITDSMREFYFKNLRYCSHCNPKHGNGKPYQILSQIYYICAEPELYFHNPSMDQINMIKNFIDIRIKNIRHLDIKSRM